MPELHLQRQGANLLIRLGELSSTIPITEITPLLPNWQQIYLDAASYGRNLYARIFQDESLRSALGAMRVRTRLVLIIDDPQLASIPWEYLRDPSDTLLAGRLTMVRAVSGQNDTGVASPAGPLEIIAIPSSPIDVAVHLNVEQEWRDLSKIVTQEGQEKAVSLRRLRPPTLYTLESALRPRGTTIVHFMGHGAQQADKISLVFENARGQSRLVDAVELAELLQDEVFLVILNSCLSAQVTPTTFGNLARELVQQGVPYALGMQCIIPDEAAQVLSQSLFRGIVQGRSLEEAVRQMRRSLLEQGDSSHPTWLAGLPALYTSLREQPAPPIALGNGQPTIIPDPKQLQQFVDLTELPAADHFLGRAEALERLLELLLAAGAHGFVLIHGLGGIGKTSLARALAERVGWHYEDHILALSFETFAALDATQQRIVNTGFLERFYTRLARFYGLDPAAYAGDASNDFTSLQQAILQQRTQQRSLLILDNIETLLDSLSHESAQECAAFLLRLREGQGAVLFTSRQQVPSDWGIDEARTIPLYGLADTYGADLFQAFLPADRQLLAPRKDREALSKRVQGHPLSIRLLAGSFADEAACDLAIFLRNIDQVLVTAERSAPSSLHDPARQKTLYACIDYSVRRLTEAQRSILDTISIFKSPFPTEFALDVIEDSEQTLVHLRHLERLGLLTVITNTFAEGELIRFELHPMVRWYIERHQPQFSEDVKTRYGRLYARLVKACRTKC